MSDSQPTNHVRGGVDRPASALDQLLRDFYRGEMPRLRPPVLPVRPVVRHADGGWGRMRSRLALAAAVGTLLVGTLLLPKPTVGTTSAADANRLDIGMRGVESPEAPRDGATTPRPTAAPARR